PCNTFTITLENHFGTHIDAPNHFYDRGRTISGYAINELVFNDPHVINLKKNEGELVVPKDLGKLKKCDVLLINTGFSKFRGSKKYVFKNPGISSEAADFIRKKYPGIKAVGIDTISISSYQNREDGRKAHRAFLDKKNYKNDPVLLIEDMNLSGSLKKIKKIYVSPLFIEKVDSAPCT
ncbi:MAG: cyclase family protein, partial [Candidatus Margulisiibacteriota bacterium]